MSAMKVRRKKVSPYTERDQLYESVLSKYLLEGEKTLDDIFYRHATEVTEGQFKIFDVTKQQLLDAFSNGLIGQGSVLYSLGNHSKYCSVSNCYFLKIRDDSIEGIMDTAKRMAVTYKFRGGCGTDLDTLRPRGFPVSNSAKTSSGAASFMPLFSEVTTTIGQAGRRGALMLTISGHHPDALEFIRMKQDLTKVLGANVSVKLTDWFMQRVERNETLVPKWESPSGILHTFSPISARELWSEIVKCAHKTAEPGVLFWDRVLEFGAASCYELLKPIGTNPCSEIPLPDDDACTLVSQYLAILVDKPYTDEARFNWKKFENQIRIAIRFLDVLKDIDNCPFESQKKIALLGRRIGLGIHGLGDCLVRLGIKYGTPEAIVFCKALARFLTNISYSESINLAKHLGAFPLYRQDQEASMNWWFEKVLDRDIFNKMMTYGRRNVQCNTVAPTGSISILCNNCTSGIEPIFRLSYARTVRLGEADKIHLVEHPEVRNYKKITKDQNGLPDYFVDSTQLTAEQRVDMQAAFAEYIDHSISSTVNLPETATVEDVDKIMFRAWKTGCKGITVYRDKCREGILNPINEQEIGLVRERPEVLDAVSHKIRIGKINCYVTVTYQNNLPFDIMATANDDLNSEIEDSIFILKSVCKKYQLINQFYTENSKAKNPLDLFMRLVSLLLRASIPINEMLSDVNCIVGSLPWHIRRILKPKDQIGCIDGKCG